MIKAVAKQWTESKFLLDSVLIICSSLLLALSAQFAFPIPFSPVPVSLQTMAVLLIGATLGAKRGALSVLLYLAEGALGFPVFAGGLSGFFVLLGPKGGYLLGFVAAAIAAGALYSQKNGIIKNILALIFANSLIYLFGLSWLSLFVGFSSALTFGLFPFVVGDLLKIFSAAASLKGISYFKFDKM